MSQMTANAWIEKYSGWYRVANMGAAMTFSLAPTQSLTWDHQIWWTDPKSHRVDMDYKKCTMAQLLLAKRCYEELYPGIYMSYSLKCFCRGEEPIGHGLFF